MQLKVGDQIVHPAYGLGQIVNIEQKQFSEKGTRLYYKITLPKRTVWIPVEMYQAIGLRLITAESDLDRYRALLTSPPAPLNEIYHRRHLELATRLKEGSFQVLCEVVRDLTAWSWRKPLGQADTATLQKARENLHQEWAAAAGISVPEAVKEIDALLRVAQHTYIG